MRGCGNERNRQRGSTLTLFALSLVSLFFILGISVDLGAAYVTQSRLSQSVDAGVLAGARNSAGSDAQIKRVALQVARANFVGPQPATYSVRIDVPEVDTKRVRMSATTDHPTTFAVMMGALKLDIGSEAEATRFPLDMSLVLDLSFSLQRNHAFKPMQAAASGFLDSFDDGSDQIGITTYSTWAEEKMPLKKYFRLQGTRAIRRLHAISDTNIQEGLRLSKSQIDDAREREGAFKVVVLFTDGRPTAYRDTFTFSGRSCPRYDGIAAAYINGSSFRGLFRASDGRKIKSFRRHCRPKTAANQSSARSITPREISRNRHQGDFVRAQGIRQAEEEADEIREEGYTIYTVGLGNPNARYAGDVPDLDFLRRLSNEGGRVDADQPRGQLIFAPSPSELEDAFAKLADRLLTRLTR